MAVKHSAKRTKRGSRLSVKQADDILKDYKRRPALMSKETVFELDAAIRADKFGVSRRLGLLFLSKPCKELIENVQCDREFAVAVAQASDSVTEYRERLGDLVSSMEESEKRMMIALATREDMQAVLAEAKRDKAHREPAHG